MKNSNTFVLAIVLAAMAGCSTTNTAQLDSEPLPEAVAYGSGRMPISMRVPVKKGHASYGVCAPFGVNRTFLFKNNVRIQGDPNRPGIITGVWVGSVNKPIGNFSSHVKVWDQPRPVPWIAYGDSICISLPPCQFLDGTPKCEVLIYAQINAMGYDMMGRQRPTYAETCASIQPDIRGGYGEIVWNDRRETEIVCAPQSQSVAVMGEKKAP